MRIVVNNHDKVDLPAMGLMGLLVPSAEITRIEYLDGRIPLDFEATVYHADRVSLLHRDTAIYANRVLGSGPKPWNSDGRCVGISRCGSGQRHVIGLIDLILKFQDMKKPIAVVHPESVAVVHPESGLQPNWVLALTDVLLDLAIRGADEDMRFEILARKADIKW